MVLEIFLMTLVACVQMNYCLIVFGGLINPDMLPSYTS
jgi:hypothetical protein